MDSNINYEEVNISKEKNSSNSYFDGGFIEYLGYSILAFLITLFSLTLAKPWADKLIIEYKISHTVYNGKRLKFEGRGSELFVERFKWILLSIITLGIYSFWISIKMKQWVVSNTHFEDEDLISGESYFEGNLLGLIGVNLFTFFITVISLGLLLPFAVCYKERWIAKNTVINGKRLLFDGNGLSLIGNYLLWYLLSIITLGIYGIWLPMKVYGWEVKNTHIKLKDEEYKKESSVPIILGIIFLVLLLLLMVSSFSKVEWNEVNSIDDITNILDHDSDDESKNNIHIIDDDNYINIG